MDRRTLGAAIAGVAITAGVVASPLVDPLRGLSLDIGFLLRHAALGPSHGPGESRVAVIAVDEETHRTSPFEGVPQVFWTRDLAPVLKATLDAGAAVVGFDVIFPTSVERFVQGHDRDFLRTLRAGAREGRIVLGKVQHGAAPIRPNRGQGFAVDHDANIRAANLFRDPDEVIRRAPLLLAVEEAPSAVGAGRQPSLGLELAARALGASPESRDDGVWLAGRRLPGSQSNNLLLDFQGGGADIPAFSLADLHACAQKGDGAFFERHFKGKVVLLGTVLDVEDRKLSSRRFMTGPDGAAFGPRCALPARTDILRDDVVRDAIPGVFIQATFVNDLLRGGGLTELGRIGEGVATGLLVAATAGLVLSLPAALAGLAFLGLATAWTVASVGALQVGLVWPLLTAILAAAAAGAVLLGFRFAVADRDKRLLRRSFQLYLAPAMVDRMMATQQLPELGGEEREVTVLFSDVVGFTALAEGLTPHELVQVMNTYLSAMTDIVEAEGGFVDKYIGDAIVAVFGAPLEDPAHARRAVEAALACAARLAEMNDDPAKPFLGHRLGARIGLNSGRALVGNIGSRRRFNYTVMGDTVNLASRLEGANRYFGSTIMCAEGVRALADAVPGPAIAWRELGAVQVKGRRQPVVVLEPTGLGDDVPATALARDRLFAEGLRRYRARDFAGAAAALSIDDLRSDGPAERLAAWAATLRDTPPGEDWQPVVALDGK